MKTIKHRRWVFVCAVGSLIAGCMMQVIAVSILFFMEWNILAIIEALLAFLISVASFQLGAKAFIWYGIMYISDKANEAEEKSVGERN